MFGGSGRVIRSAGNLVLGFLMLNSGLGIQAADWPAWRGPKGTGISDETEAPLKWSASENIAWRTEIPGRGRSSPIVSG